MKESTEALTWEKVRALWHERSCNPAWSLTGRVEVTVLPHESERVFPALSEEIGWCPREQLAELRRTGTVRHPVCVTASGTLETIRLMLAARQDPDALDAVWISAALLPMLAQRNEHARGNAPLSLFQFGQVLQTRLASLGWWHHSTTHALPENLQNYSISYLPYPASPRETILRAGIERLLVETHYTIIMFDSEETRRKWGVQPSIRT